MGRISLTVDNGPDPVVTPALLDVLAERSVVATFFPIGERVAESGGIELMDRIAAAGHRIGNHTWSHGIRFGETCDPAAIRDEVVRAEALIAPWAESPPLFRPPGGGGRLDRSLFSEALTDHLCAHGYTCVLWNVVPRDWEDVDGWVDRALEELSRQAWSVVVVHDIVPRNANRVASFIDRARDAGHELVADIAPECLPIVAGTITRDLSALTSAICAHPVVDS